METTEIKRNACSDFAAENLPMIRGTGDNIDLYGYNQYS